MTPPPTLKADKLREKGSVGLRHGAHNPQPADAYGRQRFPREVQRRGDHHVPEQRGDAARLNELRVAREVARSDCQVPLESEQPGPEPHHASTPRNLLRGVRGIARSGHLLRVEQGGFAAEFQRDVRTEVQVGACRGRKGRACRQGRHRHDDHACVSPGSVAGRDDHVAGVHPKRLRNRRA